MWRLAVLGWLSLVACAPQGDAVSSGAQQVSADSPLEQTVETAYRWVQGCGQKDMSLCLKMRALTYVDKALRRAEDISLMDGVSLVPTEAGSREIHGRAVDEAELDASLPEDADRKDAQVEGMLVDRVARFLETHTLQLKVPDEAVQQVRRSLDEARGKKKKLKMLLPLLLMLKMKAAAIIPLALGALALLALKALIVGKLALVLSALIGLQKLLGSKGQSQSYEVVAHPHYSEEHHGHYRRSLSPAGPVGSVVGADQAYRAHAPSSSQQSAAVH